MPYASVKDLPEAQVKHYSGHQRKAFMEAFNAAHAEYGDESKAFAVAHSAAKKAGAEEANPQKHAKGMMRERMAKKHMMPEKHEEMEKGGMKGGM